MSVSATSAADVIAFWRTAGAELWFARDAAFDARCREAMLDLHMDAAARRRDDWLDSPEGALALVLLTDQIPRNAFRGTAHMFATDPLARHFARRAASAGFVARVAAELRGFLLLPFEHSEDAADQERSVALHREWAQDWLSYAEGHREIIRRFGRFPHRNALLGRETTPDEAAFLAAGGFGG